jgi:hypothetical protein
MNSNTCPTTKRDKDGLIREKKMKTLGAAILDQFSLLRNTDS